MTSLSVKIARMLPPELLPVLAGWIGQPISVSIALTREGLPETIADYGGVLSNVPELDLEAEERGEPATFLLALDGGRSLLTLHSSSVHGVRELEGGAIEVELEGALVTLAPEG